MTQLPDTGWVAVVKRDCPTCELVAPVLAALNTEPDLHVIRHYGSRSGAVDPI